MEEQLEKYLAEFVELLKEGGQFAMEELPLFINEYLTWSIAAHIIGVVIGVCFLYVFSKCLLFIYKEEPKKEKGAFYLQYDAEWMHKRKWTVKATAVTIASAITPLIGIPMFISNLYSLTKVLLAPRLYLIENLMELV